MPSSARVVSIASFDFPESELLAQIYAGALRAKGFPVAVVSGVGSRELVQPALKRGLIQMVPEYAGSALSFLTLGKNVSASDVAATNRALRNVLARSGLIPLKPAPAQDANAIVVTRRIATQYGLRSISDLALHAGELRFGGPSECPVRPFCLAGLKETYGLTFKEFVPLDTGGPLTRQALEAQQIDVALMFTTDPYISRDELVMLADDRGLQPSENVTPILRDDVIARFGPAFTAAVDRVSEKLTTDALRNLNGLVSFGGGAATSVARDWLGAQGLAR